MAVAPPRGACVFIDRDGVINEDWLNPATGEWESPLLPGDFVLIDGAMEGLRALAGAGLRLFLVSNQPSFAKGKTTLKSLQAVHARFEALLDQAGIAFAACYYSYSHPQSVVAGYGGDCSDRKPSPFFLLKAAAEFDLDLAACWMIGDRETDVECGKRAGTRTIRVHNPRAAGRPALPKADFTCADLREAAYLILREYGLQLPAGSGAVGH